MMVELLFRHGRVVWTSDHMLVFNFSLSKRVCGHFHRQQSAFYNREKLPAAMLTCEKHVFQLKTLAAMLTHEKYIFQ